MNQEEIIAYLEEKCLSEIKKQNTKFEQLAEHVTCLIDAAKETNEKTDRISELVNDIAEKLGPLIDKKTSFDYQSDSSEEHETEEIFIDDDFVDDGYYEEDDIEPSIYTGITSTAFIEGKTEYDVNEDVIEIPEYQDTKSEETFDDDFNFDETAEEPVKRTEPKTVFQAVNEEFDNIDWDDEPKKEPKKQTSFDTAAHSAAEQAEFEEDIEEQEIEQKTEHNEFEDNLFDEEEVVVHSTAEEKPSFDLSQHMVSSEETEDTEDESEEIVVEEKKKKRFGLFKL